MKISGNKTAPRAAKKKKRRWPFILIALALIITALLLDSANRLVVTDYELSYESLPEGFDGYRILQLSDLHRKQFGDDNSRLLEAVEENNPDIIVLTGDFINRALSGKASNQSEELRFFLEKLPDIAPCYFVSGNHDWASLEISALSTLLGECGIKYLHNEFVFLEKGGDSIILAGVEDPNGSADMTKPDELVQYMNTAYPDKFAVLLGHRNDWLEKYPELDVELILSGHAHGGVVRLPLIGGVFGTNLDLFPKYDAGLFNEGGYDLILSRGLGNFNAIPRFLNNPEVVCVTLRKGR
ncbi:MAG: metallophosphoesterase [Oscillospiraceae bacterium]|jgi:predicted MPP superfamily phosphohydrolase|nr:metallophosphoesterase [Oscillospiraceae bacterium]